MILKVDLSYIKTGIYKKDTNISTISVLCENNSLKIDEAVISKAAASTMNAKKGDSIKLNIDGEEKTFKVHDIEKISTRVNGDLSLTGYAKVNKGILKESQKKSRIIYLKGRDGKELQNRVSKIDGTHSFSTLEKTKMNLKDNAAMESTSLGILSNVTNIFSILCIITTTLMIIMKRKRDVAVMRMISIKSDTIKKSIMFELMIYIVPAILLGTALGILVSFLLSSYIGYDAGFTLDKFNIIAKGLIFSLATFILMTLISLRVVTNVKPISVFRENEENIKKSSKRTIILSIFLSLVLFIVYSLITKNMGSVLSIIIMTMFVAVFLLFIALIIKIVCSLNHRNMKLMYCFKSMKKNTMNYILILISVTMTLCFILIGYCLKNTIIENENKAIKSSLPYNYIIEPINKNDSTQDALKSDKSVVSYTKVSNEIKGTIKNDNFKNDYKNIVIEEIDKKDYKLKFNMVKGQNLFEGDKEGVIVSEDTVKGGKITVGDTLTIKTKENTVNLKIKGIYKNAGLNSNSIYKEGKSSDGDVEYLVNAHSNKFLGKIKSCEVFNIDDVSKEIVSSIVTFLNTFMILSIIAVAASILFNINVISMSCSLEKKDEEIIGALGLGCSFMDSVTKMKIAFIVILSSILSLGVFSLFIKLFMKMWSKIDAHISFIVVIAIIIISLIINLFTFHISSKREKSFELLREE